MGRAVFPETSTRSILPLRAELQAHHHLVPLGEEGEVHHAGELPGEVLDPFQELGVVEVVPGLQGEALEVQALPSTRATLSSRTRTVRTPSSRVEASGSGPLKR